MPTPTALNAAGVPCQVTAGAKGFKNSHNHIFPVGTWYTARDNTTWHF